ncbi:hypothetical protein BDV96DRAFT_605234 [Lophiotrema nucula]|uniref:Uncharacterized protein n=1 Tax=Lophiotrema nucula TaxID=690887 RepID=A0A6A5YNF1_9PLEO|nr:hypothetical protein BDV96DRAFT_605234 [Lophiotrema nucula]
MDNIIRNTTAHIARWEFQGPQPTNTLNGGQIAGIAMGAIAVVGISIGLFIWGRKETIKSTDICDRLRSIEALLGVYCGAGSDIWNALFTSLSDMPAIVLPSAKRLTYNVAANVSEILARAHVETRGDRRGPIAGLAVGAAILLLLVIGLIMYYIKKR